MSVPLPTVPTLALSMGLHTKRTILRLTCHRSHNQNPHHQSSRSRRSVLLPLPLQYLGLSSNSKYLLLMHLLFLLSISHSVTSEPSPQPIMVPGEGDGSYSLFPDEDLRTGRKIRFEDDRLDRSRHPDNNNNYRGSDRYRSYPIMFEDRFHRPGEFGPGSSGYKYNNNNYDRDRDRDRDRSYLDSLRTRGSRVYFDDDLRDRDRNRERDRYYPGNDRFPPSSNYNYDYGRPSLLQRPLSPLQYNNNRPFHHHYSPDVPVPGPSHSKLPVGATIGNIRDGNVNGDVRIHVFDPESNSFGNPRNNGNSNNNKGRYNIKDESGLNSNPFVENGGPSPELFLNHDQYLEYHRKIALVREQEFRKLQALGQIKSDSNPNNASPDTKKLLFTSKQPFDIAGLNPPPILPPNLKKDSGKGQVAIFTGADGQVSLVGVQEAGNNENNNDNQNNGGVNNEGVRLNNNAGEIGLGNVEIESENGKSQVTHIPPERPSFISKSGRLLAYEQIQSQSQTKNNNKPTTTSSPLTTVSVTSSSTSSGSRNREININVKKSDNLNDKSGNANAKKYGRPDLQTINVRQPLSALTSIDGSGGSETNVEIGHASPLIEIPMERDGFIPNVPTFASYPDAERRKGTESKGEKSKLRTEMTKSRIKALAADKIAIIKQQDLKQMKKQKSLKDMEKLNLQKLQNLQNLENTKSTKKSVDFGNDLSNFNTQSPPLLTPVNFKIPLISNSKSSFRDKDREKRLHNDNGSYKSSGYINNNIRHEIPFLNNDLVDPHIPIPAQDQSEIDKNNESYENNESPFTLVNFNNEQIDIHDDDETLDPKSNLRAFPDLKKSQLQDLDHGDSLLFLGSNDALVNKTYLSIDTNTNEITKNTNNPDASTNFVRVVRVRNPYLAKDKKVSFAPANSALNVDLPLTTAEKTLSMFMAKRLEKSTSIKPVKSPDLPLQTLSQPKSKPQLNLTPALIARVLLSSSINSSTLAMLRSKFANGLLNLKKDKLSVAKPAVQPEPSVSVITVPIEDLLKDNLTNPKSEEKVQSTTPKMAMTMSSSSKGVIAKVHAHVSHCPKLKAPAEIICDIHIRESHGHPNPQLTVGWRRKFYNSTQPDILLVSNKTQVYEEVELDSDLESDGEEVRRKLVSGWGNENKTSGPSTNSSINIGLRSGLGLGGLESDDGTDSAKNGDSLEDFHDKFNVTLAPGISPMLRSVLLIRSVTAPDTGNYQCEVSDGQYTLKSETLLFLCH